MYGMKTRSAPVEPPNIAAIVKARHHARVLCPLGDQAYLQTCSMSEDSNCPLNATNNSPICQPGSISAGGEDTKIVADDKQKSRPDGATRLLRSSWAPDDRRLFFQGVRMFGRNFTEIARFMRSRGHRSVSESLSGASTMDSVPSIATGGSVASVSTPSVGISGSGSTPCTGIISVSSSVSNPSGTSINTPYNCSSDPNALNLARTREQVRVFYQQTWHKIRRYIKFSDDVPQRVREVYALINYSVIRTRIKKPLDHRLGEKLNELVHCGTTIIKHNGRRFLLRTPICPALKLLNHITAPSHEFLLPEDVWIELVPSSQADLWRVLEAEQNPRLRLRVDINRQLSDIIKLVEMKWQLAAERMLALFDLPVMRDCPTVRLLIRTAPNQAIDGAIRLQEVARVRSGDLSLLSFIKRRLTSKSTPEGTDVASEPQGLPEHSPRSNDGVLVSSEPMQMADDCSVVGVPPTSGSGTMTGSGVMNTIPQCTSLPSTPAPSSASSSIAELDLREMGRQLLQGVTYEAARGIKVLTLFLALGCPDRIQFEYTFLLDKHSSNREDDSVAPLGTSSQLYYQPVCTESCGISNGLRRLLHLNASDYLLHRDWLSTQNALSGPLILPRPPSCHATCTTASSTPSVVTSPAASTKSVDTFTCPVMMKPPTTPTQLTSRCSSQAVIVTSCSLVPSNSIAAAAVVNIPKVSPFSPVPVCSSSTAASISSPLLTTASSIPSPSSMLTAIPPPPAPSITPSLIVFPTNVGSKTGKHGQVPVVERQLDHQRTSGAPEKLRFITPSPLPAPKVPISKYSPSSTRLDSTCMTPSSRTPISIMPRPADYVRPITISSTDSPIATSGEKVSSLNSMKAYNMRRRTSVSNRGGRRSLKSIPVLIPTSSNTPAARAAFPNPLPTVPPTNVLAVSVGAAPLNSLAITSTPLSSSLPTSTLPVLNANSLIHFDGDISLGTLFGTNQSSVSFSNDTLVSLLKTICSTSAASMDSNMSTGPVPESIRAAPNAQTVPLFTNSVNLSANGVGRNLNHNHPPQLTNFKCEELSRSSENTDWSDFHTSHDSCPVASTPHAPPESPAFGDISLTDSMAAAVMGIHQDDSSSQDLELLSPGPAFTSEWSRDTGFSQASDASSMLKPPLSAIVTTPVPRTCSGVDYMSNMEAFLRLVHQPATPSSGPSSVEPGTVDLNTLLQSVDGPNTDIVPGLFDSQSE